MFAAFLSLFVLFSYNIEDPRYHTFDEVVDDLNMYREAYPELTLLDTLGYTEILHRPILALKISDNAEEKEDEPSVLFDGVHHAEEILGCELTIALIDTLLTNYDTDPHIHNLVNETEIWCLPILNPDGHWIVMSLQDTSWRKNLRDNNENGHIDLDYDGVDPNRNYDFNWDLGGDTIPSGYFYRGPYPFSEPETQAMRDFCERELPVALINYHSPSYSRGEIVYYPWIWSGHSPPLSPDHEHLLSIAKGIAESIENDAGNGHYLAVVGEAEMGAARNWQYGVLGISAFNIEICSFKTQPPGDSVDDIVWRNLDGVFWLLDRVHRSGIKVHVVDSMTGEPIQAECTIEEIDGNGPPPPRETNPVTGSSYRLLNPGNYTLHIHKDAYRDTVIPVTIDSLSLTEVDVALSSAQGIREKTESGKSANFLTFNRPTLVKFSLYSVSGRSVLEEEKILGPGTYPMTWDGLNLPIRGIPKGIYFLKLKTGEKVKVVKISNFPR